ncbi:transcriptional regulator [Bordetella genomosp. 10]|uniref:Transcriptional regulator n=1 Tax=Bordetella genomosp. 10 TaxID=1416804 RepID=A0A261S2S2_9BORD|nr:LysR substrate-binding domain-containing protein [Bordetella genomosp. 10]OZI31232.1 transcriptional regulator [Bordetella genomosp. 10]
MELRHLRYFVGVCDAGSLLKAANRLHIAQPALGQQISALEEEVGTKLFERSSRGMAPTEAGKVLLEHARAILIDTDRACAAARNVGTVPRGEVALGLPTTVALVATLPILVACRTRLPEVKLKLVEGYSGHLREWLLSGRLDLTLMFGESPEESIQKTLLLDDRLVFVSTAQGKKLPKTLPITALSEEPLVLPSKEHGLRRGIDEACEPRGVELNVIAEIDSLGSAKLAAEAGIGSTILPHAAVAAEVMAGRLQTAIIDSPGFLRRVVCATNTGRTASTGAIAVKRLIWEVLKDMVDSGAWPATWAGGDTRP